MFWVCVCDRAAGWPLSLQRLPDFKAGMARRIEMGKKCAGQSSVEVEGYMGSHGLEYLEELLGSNLSEVQVAESCEVAASNRYVTVFGAQILARHHRQITSRFGTTTLNLLLQALHPKTRKRTPLRELHSRKY